MSVDLSGGNPKSHSGDGPYLRDLLTSLAAARRSSQFYPPEHPAVAQAIGDLKSAIDGLQRGGAELTLTFFDGELVFEDRVMTQESILFDQLIRSIGALGIESMQIVPGVSSSELARAMRILSADASDIEAAGGIERATQAAGLTGVRFGHVRLIHSDVEASEEAHRDRRAYEGAVDLIRDMDQIVRSGRTPDHRFVRTTVAALVDSVQMRRSAMLELASLRDFDHYTFYHSANVAILSLALGSLVTEDARFLGALGTGALLHDIGKMTVDRDILNKTGALTPEEWNSMRDHPVSGARMAARMPGLDQSAAVVILEHHMAYDGSGYPRRHSGQMQHLASRIVAVADAYDAMTSRRSYSEARPQDEAMALVAESAGSTLDPTLVRLFVMMLGVYPPRSVVRLGDGSTAVVVRPGESDPLRPVVRVIAAPTGELVEPGLLDLGGSGAPDIERCLDPASLNIEVDDYL
ncbi:MAG: HD-GYP domain-containing protein [Anaerosomatales bacterium]|nr:HD-GYP domain-containing protein [Anaerosomatales bacterium]MDT8433662.1 HD-GYP domain-containing protein [Anaerosomatales bacterium]